MGKMKLPGYLIGIIVLFVLVIAGLLYWYLSKPEDPNRRVGYARVLGFKNSPNTFKDITTGLDIIDFLWTKDKSENIVHYNSIEDKTNLKTSYALYATVIISLEDDTPRASDLVPSASDFISLTPVELTSKFGSSFTKLNKQLDLALLSTPFKVYYDVRDPSKCYL